MSPLKYFTKEETNRAMWLAIKSGDEDAARVLTMAYCERLQEAKLAVAREKGVEKEIAGTAL